MHAIMYVSPAFITGKNGWDMHIPRAPIVALAESWRGEHAGYYGLPHGAASISAAMYPVPDWAIRYGRIACGLQVYGNFCLWVRSSGTWLLCDIAENTIEVAGRRHSISERLPEYIVDAVSRYTYFDTAQSHWRPWETQDSYAERMEALSAAIVGE